MSDRIFGVFVLALSALMGWRATAIEESFIQDPLGPKAFPLLIIGLMALAAIVMMLKPDEEPHWPGLFKLAELFATVGVLAAYAKLLPEVGFILSTAVATTFLCWRLGANARQSVQGGVLTSLGIYLVFQFGLGINLAKGPWGF